MPHPRQIIVVVPPAIELLDVTGPVQVFSAASQLIGSAGRGYHVRLAAREAGEVTAFGGVRLMADTTWAEAQQSRVDTLIVPGSVDIGARGSHPEVDAELVSWVQSMAPQVRRTVAVCHGTHVLAAAGLLDGRRATTHWSCADRLAEDYPEVQVDPDPIFVQSGKVWTCAGGSAAVDLALALVAQDHGPGIAQKIARWLVMYLRRTAGQSQFSVQLSLQHLARDDLNELLTWISDHLRDDVSVPVLAKRMGLSVRHFSRVFRAETGLTPAAYVEVARVEYARRLLEETERTLDGVADACGLRSVETLHRSFRRQLSTTPGEYRRRLQPQRALFPDAPGTAQ